MPINKTKGKGKYLFLYNPSPLYIKKNKNKKIKENILCTVNAKNTDAQKLL
jgi:hypothetical protein